MNHFMLPDGGGDAGSPMSASMRYGAYAMEVLINQLLKAGARRENLEAKVFGGGNVLRGFTTINVGERNAQFVRDFLRAENIRVVAEDLNDVHPRKVYFFPQHRQGAGQETQATQQLHAGEARAGLRKPAQNQSEWAAISILF